jgi:hypothetical protein
VADQLATIPAKVVTLQSSAFENAEQVRALNLALIRAENSQREGKALATDDGDTTGISANKSKTSKPPLFPEIPRKPPKNHFSAPPPESGRGQYDDEDDFTDNRFHLRVRLEFPSFDGKEDPLPWLNRWETFFRVQGTPERRRVWYAAMHLTGAAQLWYARLELTSGTSPWRRFAQLVQQRFGPPMTNSPVGELMLLRRTGSVEDYTDQFLAFACRDADLSEQQLVQIYTAGLVNPLKTGVALRRPASLDDAIMFARAYEQRLQLVASDLPPGRTPRAVQQSGSASTRVVASAQSGASSAVAPPGSGKSSALSSTLPRRRLSPAEMAQRRADGLCYNCDEKFVLGHRCKKLFVI